MHRLKLSVLAGFVFLGLFFLLSRPQVSGVAGSIIAGTLAAPTGVSASDSAYSDKVGIHWDTIRDATVYRVYRNVVNDGSSSSDVGTTTANYFFDAAATAGQTYFYWVRAENSGTVSDLGSPDTGTRAIGMVLPGFEPLEPPTAPVGNAITAARSYLGKTLFWDEQLSSTRTVSCGTCHRPATGGSDPRTVIGSMRSRNPGFDNVFNTADDVFGSPGVPQNGVSGSYFPNTSFGFNEQVTGRKSPTYLNAGYSRSGLFWDGRATDEFRDQLTNNVLLAGFAALESQSAGPPLSSAEMAHGGRNWTEVAARIQASSPLAVARNIPTALKTWIGNRNYPQLFEEAFGTSDVTPARISMAIATHERTLFSDRTPFDGAAMQIQPLTGQEENGRQLFESLQCNACHGGALFSDNSFHNIGVRPQTEDRGRGAITMNVEDDARFKTPTLRNVELHAPYMHNGRFATLEDIVDFYDRGGDFDAPNIDHSLIRPLNLTVQEKAELVAFLKRPLTDSRVQNELPPFDRPQLYTESNRVPQITGVGRAGSGAIVPRAIAIEPPLVGNPSFTLCVANGLGSAAAVMVIDSADPGVGTSIPASGAFARVATNLSGSGSGNGYTSVNFAIPNNAALVGRTFFGRWYITDAGALNGFSVSPIFQFTIFGEATAQRAISDFDGDGKSDVAVWRETDGDWYRINSSDGLSGVEHFGSNGDKIVPGDYDGDGKTDMAVWRPSTSVWYVAQSGGGSTATYFGLATDMPAQGDFDGDGKTDIALYRPSTGTWYFLRSTLGLGAVNFGLSGDKPVPGDYDGDGTTDIAVYRPSEGIWYIMQSNDGFRALYFGISTDKVVPADYDGDGKTDVAVFRDSTGDWYQLRSTEGLSVFRFGTSGDIPGPGDFDGDGRADINVYRPSQGTWYRQNSSNGSFFGVQFGINSDKPITSGYVPVQ